MAADNVGSLPCGWVVTDRFGQPHKAPPHFPLARDKVRYVGDHVAVVLAETLAQAKDASELISVDYEELPAAADLAAYADAPLVHDEVAGNLCFDWTLGDEAAVDAALAGAHKVVSLDLINNRLIPNAMEPRACVAEYDVGMDNYTLFSTSQNPHLLRLILCAFVLGLPETKLRVVAPDVGGAPSPAPDPGLGQGGQGTGAGSGVGAGSGPGSGSTGPRLITGPSMAQVRANHPRQARSRYGRVELSCRIRLDSRLEACRVVEETPVGLGFGAAGLAVADYFRFQPPTENGRPLEGQQVTVGVDFGIPPRR